MGWKISMMWEIGNCCAYPIFMACCSLWGLSYFYWSLPCCFLNLQFFEYVKYIIFWFFHIFLSCRYDMTSNRWAKETCVPKKASDDASVGFVALDGELHLLTLLNVNDSTDGRRSRQHKRSSTLLIQIYNPRKSTWRSLIVKPPFHQPLDFRTAVMCTIRL